MSRELREEVFGEVLAHDNDCRGNGFSGRVEARKETTDRLLAIIAREVEAALTAARPRIERETREACAKVAENYGPSRPMATNMAFSVIRGRWEGEQAASANIAAAIRGEPT